MEQNPLKGVENRLKKVSKGGLGEKDLSLISYHGVFPEEGGGGEHSEAKTDNKNTSDTENAGFGF